MMTPLSLADFADRIASDMDMPVEALLNATFEELGFDSLHLFELDLIVEEIGVLLPEEAFIGLRNLSDVYAAYVAALDL
jgi:acyl carrier protein